MKRLLLAVSLFAATAPAFAQSVLSPEPMTAPRPAPAQNMAAEPRNPARAPVQLDRLQRADGASVVPEKFLRRWDPITVFFDADTGPAAGGPEDNPARVVTMSPGAPGSWQWLNARTLQFRPAEPWRARR